MTYYIYSNTSKTGNYFWHISIMCCLQGSRNLSSVSRAYIHAHQWTTGLESDGVWHPLWRGWRKSIQFHFGKPFDSLIILPMFRRSWSYWYHCPPCTSRHSDMSTQRISQEETRHILQGRWRGQSCSLRLDCLLGEEVIIWYQALPFLGFILDLKKR